MNIHLEQLLGRNVVDANGKHVGRIEEAIAEKRDGEWIVTTFLVGRFGIAERFSVHHFGTFLLRLFGAHSVSPKADRIPCEKLDLSDPEQPRLKQ
jgi:hypothetical protein